MRAIAKVKEMEERGVGTVEEAISSAIVSAQLSSFHSWESHGKLTN